MAKQYNIKGPLDKSKIVNFSTESNELKIQKVHHDDSGYDLKSKIETEIKPGEFKTIPTGIRLQLPKEIEAEIRPRSGYASKYGITVLNNPGTIDSGYRGEIKVILINHGKETVRIKKWDKIAQILFREKLEYSLIQVDYIKENETERGDKGFGSSDISKKM